MKRGANEEGSGRVGRGRGITRAYRRNTGTSEFVLGQRLEVVARPISDRARRKKR